MHGRMILSSSAAILFLLGAAAQFAAEEVAHLLDPAASRSLPLAVQLAGSGMLGFGALNWMSRGVRIGGIYGRPLGIGNLLLSVTAALTLGRAAWVGGLPIALSGLAIVFAALALAFAWLVFANDPFAESGR